MPARAPGIANTTDGVGRLTGYPAPGGLLDEHLARFFGVNTRGVLQAVRGKFERLSPDFMSELSATEWTALRSQSVIPKPGRGGRRCAPGAFTEQGVAMLSSVLNGDRGITANIEIMRSFVRIRTLLEADGSPARKFERRHRKPASRDQAIVGILAAIRQLMAAPEPKRRGMGFTADWRD